MQVVHFRVLEVATRADWFRSVVQWIRESRGHFRLYLSYRWINVLSQDQEVIGRSTLNLLDTNGQVVLHIVFSHTRVRFVKLKAKITRSTRLVSVVNMSLIVDLARVRRLVLTRTWRKGVILGKALSVNREPCNFLFILQTQLMLLSGVSHADKVSIV